MDRELSRSRRQFLKAVSVGTVGALAGCNESGDPNTSTAIQTTTELTSATDTPTERSTEAPTETPKQWDVAPADHDNLIGSHYYPWYNSQYWTDFPSVGDPTLGEYDSRDTEVINQHIKWAVEHGINWFSMSWWGKDTKTDKNIKDNFLDAELSDYIQFSILYESGGSLELNDGGFIDFDENINHQQLRRDFQYFEEEYFNQPTYIQMDGKPVIFIYSAEAFKGAAAEAINSAKDAIDNDPYLIASNLGGGIQQLNNNYMKEFDAATIYNPYNPESLKETKFENFREYIVEKTEDWFLATQHAGIDFIPVVSPGYNDTKIRDNPVIERSADQFRNLCRTVSQMVDSDINTVLVTSFNEWPEYTAIEPGDPYGETYLDIIKEEFTGDNLGSIDEDKYTPLKFDFNRTFVPKENNPDSNDDRPLAFMAGELMLLDDSGEVQSYNIGKWRSEDFALVEGVYNAKHTPDDSPSTWRWFGGPTGQTVIYVSSDIASDTTEGIISGKPALDNEIEADVYFNNTQTDTIRFGVWENEQYKFSLI